MYVFITTVDQDAVWGVDSKGLRNHVLGMDLDPRWKGHFGGNIWQDSPAVDILELIHMGSAAMRPLAIKTVATCLFYSYNK